MTLPLTTETLAAAWDYLAVTPPFSKWNMPESEDVRFKPTRDKSRFGWHRYDYTARRHEIYISRSLVLRSSTLLMVMAHEMIHVHQFRAGLSRAHNDTFHRWGREVCGVHGFDVGLF